MKWPNTLYLIRHDTSAYNVLRAAKAGDPLYDRFLKEWEKDYRSAATRELAEQVNAAFALRTSDSATPLADSEGKQASMTGERLRHEATIPDVIFVSPYRRTLETLAHLTEGWPELATVRVYRDERIREQEHGLSLLYNDWRVFQTFHPEQRLLREQEGRYWYRHPQGENVPDVRLRNHSWLDTLIRGFSGQNVLVVTHHLNILATRANLERLDADEFVRLDQEEAPINCGVTLYRGHAELGENGRLVLEYYNRKYY
jgi:broad specificity phosphatase PhoE